MYLVYQPEGTEEPQRWSYDPKRLMSADRETIEKRTGRPYQEAITEIFKGGSLARRALLFVFLRRSHKGLRWEDVDFAWDELSLQFSRQEYQQILAETEESYWGEDREQRLAALHREMDAAYDEDEDGEGKAPRPSASASAGETPPTS